MKDVADILLARSRAWAELRMCDRILRAMMDAGDLDPAMRVVVEATLNPKQREATPEARATDPVPAPKIDTPVAAPEANEPAPSRTASSLQIEAAKAHAAGGKRGNRWTEARIALLRRDWSAGRDVREIHADLIALPGDPFPTGKSGVKRIGIQASYLGLKRPPGYRPKHGGGAFAPNPFHVSVQPPPQPTAPTLEEILGPKIERQKPGPKPAPAPVPVRTEARLAVVAQQYPANVPLDEIVRRCNALPGALVSQRDVMAWVVARGWVRDMKRA